MVLEFQNQNKRNFENKKIGLYNNEDFLFNKEGVVVRWFLL